MGDGNTLVETNQFTHIFPEVGTYLTQLYVENEQGCVDSITYNIIINPVFAIYIPSSFTPNNDGINDDFGPVLREGGYNAFSIQIFNQWGEIIFEEDNLFWDGKINGNLCQNGTYAYNITVYDFLDKKYSRIGSVILAR